MQSKEKREKQEIYFYNNIIHNKKNLMKLLDKIRRDRAFAFELKIRSIKEFGKFINRDIADFFYYINIFIELCHFELSEREKSIYGGILYGFERFIASN